MKTGILTDQKNRFMNFIHGKVHQFKFRQILTGAAVFITALDHSLSDYFTKIAKMHIKCKDTPNNLSDMHQITAVSAKKGFV
jgi:hypothetical protein